MRTELGLRCKQRRKFKATTNSKHRLPVAENRLNQDFIVSRPNQAWVTDLTYILSDEAWLYLAGIKDLYTCEIVGYVFYNRQRRHSTLGYLSPAAFSTAERDTDQNLN